MWNGKSFTIRVRVWDKKENKFLGFNEPYILINNEKKLIVARPYRDTTRYPGLDARNLNEWNFDWRQAIEEKDRYEISQSTGLYDSYGVEIFVGDILVAGYSEGTVVFNDHGICFQNKEPDYSCIDSLQGALLSGAHVVGTIWERELEKGE